MTDFIESGDSRETSREIIEAIWFVSSQNEQEAVRIWEDPTEAEALAIWKRVTKNGLVLSSDFCWGEAGSGWAKEIEDEDETP